MLLIQENTTWHWKGWICSIWWVCGREQKTYW